MRSKIRNRNKKKGMTSIEIAVSVLIAIITIGGLADISNILQKNTAVTSMTTYVARVAGKQGGIRTEEINNFSGHYITSQEVYRNVKNSFETAGIKQDDFTVTVDGVELGPNTNTQIRDYGSNIDINIKYKYTWGITSNWVPGLIEGSNESNSSIFTTFKIRDKGFE